MVDIVNVTIDKAAAAASFNLPPEGRIVGLFPAAERMK
jgi:hypothetical protein